jgi:hypothetical protein
MYGKSYKRQATGCKPSGKPQAASPMQYNLRFPRCLTALFPRRLDASHKKNLAG